MAALSIGISSSSFLPPLALGAASGLASALAAGFLSSFLADGFLSTGFASFLSFLVSTFFDSLVVSGCSVGFGSSAPFSAS